MKKILLTLLQLSVTVGVLLWVFWDADKRLLMAEALKDVRYGWFLVGIVCGGVVMFGGILRWQVLLRVQGIRMPWTRTGRLFFIGAFFNLFMLGATGGDVVKILYTLREAGKKKSAAFLSVVMDRVIGLMALMVLSIIFIVWRYEWMTQTAVTRGLLYSLILILAAAISGIVFSLVITGLGWVDKLPARFPLREKFVELAAAYNAYARAWPAALFAFLLSMGLHLAYFGIFYCASRALKAVIPFFDFCAIMPIVNTITALPISLSGVGVREKLFEELLGDLSGVQQELAVLTSVTGFLVIIFWGLVGAAIYPFYRPSKPSDPEQEARLAAGDLSGLIGEKEAEADDR